MAFERLLFTSCLLPGVTRFQENNTFVEIKPQAGETILFFCIDNHSKGHPQCKDCRLRNDLWGDQEGQRICDLVVFYAKKDRRVLCFVELKDNKSDLTDATEQVINTYRGFKRHLRLTNQYLVQAFLIGHHGSVHTKHQKKDEKNLKKEFGDNYIYAGDPFQFETFLRQGRQKKKRGRKGKSKGVK